MQETSPILWTEHDGIVTLRLNRPDAMNALSPDLVQALSNALDDIRRLGVAQVLLIRGEGRAFCAGGDLKFFKDTIDANDSAGFRRFLELCRDTFRKIETFPCPTIAVINGVTVAGGLELVLSCDLAIAAASARIGDGHANFGIVPGGGGAIRLPRKLPTNLAKYLLLTGELFPSAQWQSWGLVCEVAPEEELDARAMALAGRIRRNSALCMRLIKQLANDGLEQPLVTALDSEILAWDAYSQSKDVREGLAAFSQKRPPVFTGQ